MISEGQYCEVGAGELILDIILDIEVKLTETVSVSGKGSYVSLVSFEGKAEGKYFTGKTIGSGVDTQRTDKNTGKTRLSARYMLEGTDIGGEKCRIFIENNSNESGGFTPVVVTDSKALSFLEETPLSAEIAPTADGVNVKVYTASVER